MIRPHRIISELERSKIGASRISTRSVLLLLITSWHPAWAAERISDSRAILTAVYELKVVRMSDTRPVEYVFVVGKSGFKTFDSLKDFIRRLPPGSTIRWDPGCIRIGGENPPLYSEKEVSDLKDFCERYHVRFQRVPSG